MIETFMDKCLRGVCTLDQIDDFVGEWHDSDSTLPLSEFLGMTFAEYKSWVENAESLANLVQSRKDNMDGRV